MNPKTFEELYVAELQEARSMEEQLSAALPKMAIAAGRPELAEAIERHYEETCIHFDRMDEMLRKWDADPDAHTDQTMEAIVAEGKRWLEDVTDPLLSDACLIATAQRIEHYEIAVYGTLASWAEQLGRGADAKTLHDVLQQEKEADHTLTRVAKSTANPAARAA